MTTAHKIFLIAVTAIAVIFAGLALSQAGKSLSASSAGIATGAAGQPRNVDIEKIQQMMRRNYLSDHEAAFYRKSEEAPETPRQSGQSGQ